MSHGTDYVTSEKLAEIILKSDSEKYLEKLKEENQGLRAELQKVIFENEMLKKVIRGKE